MIHDIGLLGLPEKLCVKDEKDMTGPEFKMFSHHPVIGSTCLEAVEKLTDVGKIILYHHEHFDGSGFPAGLKGDKIPLGSRIIGAVSDYCKINTSWPDDFKKIVAKAQRFIGPSAKNLVLTDRKTMIDEIIQKYLLSRGSTIYDPDIVSKLIRRLNATNSSIEGQPKTKKVLSVHFEDLKVGMVLAMTLRTKDGRFVLGGDAVINSSLLPGIKKLAQGQAIKEKIPVWANPHME